MRPSNTSERYTHTLTSVPLLREEGAAKRGCKHQAGGQKDGGGCFRRRDGIKEGSNVPSLTTDPQAPLERERLKLGIAAGRQDGRTAVRKMGGKKRDPEVRSPGPGCHAYLHEGFLLQGVHDDGGDGWKKELRSDEFCFTDRK